MLDQNKVCVEGQKEAGKKAQRAIAGREKTDCEYLQCLPP